MTKLTKGKGKKVDYLSEDPYITGQRYCLVTIIGPHVQPKADVWGIKVRYVGETMEQMKKMAKQLRQMDPDYNIFIMEMGKFGPLNISPEQVSENEYLEEKLNEMVKGYLENRELAKQHWHERKNEMMKEAIKDGKNQEELASRPEHPVSVLQRVNNYKDKLKSLQEQLDSLQEDLRLSEEKYSTYSEEDRVFAENELNKLINEDKDSPNVTSKEETLKSISDIKSELLEHVETDESNDTIDTSVSNEIEHVLSELKLVDSEIAEITQIKNKINPSETPNYYKKISEQLDEFLSKQAQLKEKLQNVNSINEYINNNYKGKSEHSSLFE